MGNVQDVLEQFGPATREWFRAAFAAPTAAQSGAWQAIGAGRNAVVVAPTGSGKTLAAFLWSIDRLLTEPVPADRTKRCRVLYGSRRSSGRWTGWPASRRRPTRAGGAGCSTSVRSRR
jgi:ATP-dependent Lhr-like helicase